MKLFLTSVATITLALILADDPSFAQKQNAPLSPRDSIFFRLDTNIVSVNYGRPSVRGRKIFGELVPWNKVWRTGANEATHLKTNFDMTIGGVPLMRGTYTLWTLPTEKGWQFIINKQTGQWGTRYDATQDYARFDAIVEQLDEPVETLTVAFDGTSNTSGRLKLMWDNTMVWTRFEKSNDIRPVSPLDSAETLLNNATLKVKYSKPFARGRGIWGVVVPFDSVWRTGANFATVLEVGTPVTMGGAEIPAGVYTVYSKPKKDGLTLMINKKAPGRAEYDAAQDHARIELAMKSPASSIDPFKIWFEPSSQKGTAYLKLGWGDREYTVDVVAK